MKNCGTCKLGKQLNDPDVVNCTIFNTIFKVADSSVLNELKEYSDSVDFKGYMYTSVINGRKIYTPTQESSCSKWIKY